MWKPRSARLKRREEGFSSKLSGSEAPARSKRTGGSFEDFAEGRRSRPVVRKAQSAFRHLGRPAVFRRLVEVPPALRDHERASLASLTVSPFASRFSHRSEPRFARAATRLLRIPCCAYTPLTVVRGSRF